LAHARLVMHPDNVSIFAALAKGDANLVITDRVEAELQSVANPTLCVADAIAFEPVQAHLIPAHPHWRDCFDSWFAKARNSEHVAKYWRVTCQGQRRQRNADRA
jgi:ABC-type amino acid transport substrate-binding protein